MNMQPRALYLGIFLVCLALTREGQAEPARAAASASPAEASKTIDSARIRLADLGATAREDLAELDLGRAPPPGSSRLFSRDDVTRELRSQGYDVRGLNLPQTVRVTSAARHFSVAELTQLIQPRAEAALPQGVTLSKLKIARALLTTPRLEVGELHLPKLPKRAGPYTVTTSVDLIHGEEIALRLPVTLELVISEQAAAPLVDRGARIDLVIQRGTARISASGTALEQGDVGDVASFKVSTTLKVLRARIDSATSATVVTP